MGTVTRIFALALLAFISAACYSAPGAQPAGAAGAGAPSLTIVSPAEGAGLSESDVAVSVKVSSFTIKGAAGANQPNEGHLHMTLDGGALTMVYGGSHTISGVPEGKHILAVELVNNDHSSLSPPVKKEVSFTTRAAVAPAPAGRYGY